MAYSIALILVTLWAMWSAMKTERGGLFRCAGAVLIQFAAYQFMSILGEGWERQPYFTNLFMLVAVFLVVVMRPRDRWHAVVGGIILGGILSTLIYGAHVLWNGYTAHADWAYWLSLFGMGCAVLVVLLGWTHEQGLRRFIAGCRGAIDGVVQRYARGGVAR